MAQNAGDENLFLKYDRHQIISAQIASFDKASHRYLAQIFAQTDGFFKRDRNLLSRLANNRFLEDKKQFLLNRLQAKSTENDVIGNSNTLHENELRPQSIVENDVIDAVNSARMDRLRAQSIMENDDIDSGKSSRVQLSRFIREEFRSSVSRNSIFSEERRRSVSRSSVFAEERRSSVSRNSVFAEGSRNSVAAENMKATALRRSLMVHTSIKSSLDTGTLKISSLVGRCVYTSEVGIQSFFLF
jgi:hypothetical protein